MRKYILELLLEDNEEMALQRINSYVEEIIKELKFCRITQKSVDEISLHEFVTRDGYVLLVTVIYNGDFDHSFNVYGGKTK